MVFVGTCICPHPLTACVMATEETKHTSMARLLKSSGRGQPGQGNELHALARSQRGPFPPVPLGWRFVRKSSPQVL
jgi:hypothetical protein